jgi:hypothetical protein
MLSKYQGAEAERQAEGVRAAAERLRNPWTWRREASTPKATTDVDPPGWGWRVDD